jgi:putative SOS response-associated peptidase YedK
MCGRVVVKTSPKDLADLFGLLLAQGAWQGGWRPSHNAAPTSHLPAVLNTQASELTSLFWGFTPAWAKPPLKNRFSNARAETLFQKPTFQKAAAARRCALLVDGFFEWKVGEGGKKQPHFIHRQDGRPLALAGIWETWVSPEGSPVVTCAVVTTSPNALMAPIHDRMPVLLDGDGLREWLSPAPQTPEALAGLFAPRELPELQAYPVSTRVNSVRNDSPECLERAA